MNEENLIHPGERVDDLQLQKLHIIQSPNAFRFSMDSVLLSDFAALRSGMRVCDLGTGTGILPLLLYGRNPNMTCDAVEIQQDAADRARRTMLLNELANQITVHCRDLRDVKDYLPHAKYDLVVCNPPYSAESASLPSPKEPLRVARQEALCTLDDIAAAAAWLLKNRGKLALMLPAARLTEAFETMKSHRLEPKRLRLVHGKADRPARLALIEAMTDCSSGLIVESPLIVQNPDGSDSDEIKRIYHL